MTIPTEAYGTIALAVGWFVLGFLLYATVVITSRHLAASPPRRLMTP